MPWILATGVSLQIKMILKLHYTQVDVIKEMMNSASLVVYHSGFFFFLVGLLTYINSLISQDTKQKSNVTYVLKQEKALKSCGTDS